MLPRAIACCVALILALLFCLNAGAEPCEGASCQAAKLSRPLDIMKFMREQAASTRAADDKVRKKPRQPKHRTVAARPAPIPTEAATSFAAQPTLPAVPEVEVVGSDELNAIDRAGEAAPETFGTAAAVEPVVQVADAGAANNGTGKAEDRPPSPAATSRDAAPSSESQSWMEWVWSAFKGTFVALAAAVHHLIG